jgi:hypothetical protein
MFYKKINDSEKKILISTCKRAGLFENKLKVYFNEEPKKIQFKRLMHNFIVFLNNSKGITEVYFCIESGGASLLNNFIDEHLPELIQLFKVNLLRDSYFDEDYVSEMLILKNGFH